MTGKNKEKECDFGFGGNGNRIDQINPFSTPSGYFDESQKEIMLKVNVIAEIGKSQAENSYTVPEGYFHELPQRIREQIDSGSAGKFWKEQFIPVFRPQISLFMVALLLLVFFAISTRKLITIQAPEFAISVEELQNSMYLSTLDESLLMETVTVNGMLSETDSETESYMQYLIDNHIELTQINIIL